MKDEKEKMKGVKEDYREKRGGGVKRYKKHEEQRLSNILEKKRRKEERVKGILQK